MPLTRIDSAFLDLDAIGGIDFDVQSGVPTLSVDATNHRVGIGTNSPTTKLEVIGDITVSKQNAFIELKDPDTADANYQLKNTNGTFDIYDVTNNAVKIRATAGYVTIYPNLNANNGLDVLGTITGDSNLDIDGLVRPGNGTQGAPSHSFRNDTDNGMYRPAVNNIAFVTGGTERLRIDSSGRIGIGGNGVGNGLGVYLRRPSPNTTHFYEASDGTKTMITGVDSTNDYVKIGSLSNHRVGLVANNGEKISILPSGNVGIGTDNPQGKLVVSDGSNGLEFNPNSNNAIVSYNRTTSAYAPNGLQGSTVQLRIGGVGTALHVHSDGKVGIGQVSPQGDLHIGNISGSKDLIMHSANNGNARVRFREGGNNASGFNEYSIGMVGNRNALTFNGQGAGEILTIKGDTGFVGIGQGSPNTSLEIQHSSYISRDVMQPLIRLVCQSNTEYSGNQFSAGVGIEFTSRWTGGSQFSIGRIGARGSQSYDGGLQFDVARNSGAGQFNYETAMVINKEGYVGINDTLPTHILDIVDGNNRAYFWQGNDSTMGLYMYDNSNHPVAIKAYGDQLRFLTTTSSGGNPTPKMTILTNGNVGVGTNNPSGKLQVGSSSASHVIITPNTGIDVNDGAINLYQATTNANAVPFVISSDVGGTETEKLRVTAAGVATFSNSTGELIIRSTTGNDCGKIILRESSTDAWSVDGGAANGTFIIKDEYNNGSRLSIGNTGNVGINESSPTRTLSINGDVNIKSGSRIESYSSSGNLIIQGGSTWPGGHIQMYGGSGDDKITFNTTGGAFTNQREQMRINNTSVRTGGGSNTGNNGYVPLVFTSNNLVNGYRHGTSTRFIGQISPANAGNTYLHVKIDVPGGAMFWIHSWGYMYGQASFHNSQGVGYFYGSSIINTTTSNMNSNYPLHIYRTSDGELGLRIYTGQGTSNAWGFHAFEGGFDGIAGNQTDHVMRILAYTWSSSSANQY